jgi:hypothetical protein
MGWTGTRAIFYNKRGQVDRKAECDSVYNSEMVSGEDKKVIGKFTVLKSTMVGSVYYAAVRKTKFATEETPEETKVFAGICLTSVDNKKDSYDNFFYRDMDESEGVGCYDCPASILRLLSDTKSEFAKEWREKCWERIAEKKAKNKNPNSLNNLPIGSVIEMPYWEGGSIRLIKVNYTSPKTIWRNGNRRCSTKTIEQQGYTVIRRGFEG